MKLKNTYIKYLFLVLITFFFSMCSSWQPDFKHAHPNAKKLMPDDFLWSPIEDTSPFGNDDGADAVFEFYKWRKANNFENPEKFIDFILTKWDYATYDYHLTDTIAIKQFIESRNIGDRLYFGIDDIIISTGFGQLVIEGKVDTDIKALTLVALNRQLMPFSLRMVDKEYRNKRILHLKRMIEIINAAQQRV
jgi:uncharacterized protein YfeS